MIYYYMKCIVYYYMKCIVGKNYYNAIYFLLIVTTNKTYELAQQGPTKLITKGVNRMIVIS